MFVGVADARMFIYKPNYPFSQVLTRSLSINISFKINGQNEPEDDGKMLNINTGLLSLGLWEAHAA